MGCASDSSNSKPRDKCVEPVEKQLTERQQKSPPTTVPLPAGGLSSAQAKKFNQEYSSAEPLDRNQFDDIIGEVPPQSRLDSSCYGYLPSSKPSIHRPLQPVLLWKPTSPSFNT